MVRAGGGPAGLGGGGPEADVLALCEGWNPQTGERLTQRLNSVRRESLGGELANRRVLYDFTISPPKSVSVVALYQDDRILALHGRAVRVAMAETAPDVGRQSILRDGSPLKVPSTFTPAPREETTPNHESRPRAARERAAERKPPAALPISLFPNSASADATELSRTYAPCDRMIPCETVVAIEPSRLDTPVIGLVTEDVWHDGRLIITGPSAKKS